MANVNEAAEKAAAEFGLEDALPDGWRPEEGSLIIGPVRSLSRGWSDQSNSFYPIVVIHDESTGSDVAVHGFHFVLKEKLLELKPREGERIGIRMGAKVPLKSNPSQSVQTYTVKIEGRTTKAEDVWSEIQNPRVQGSQQQMNVGQDATATTVADDSDIPF